MLPQVKLEVLDHRIHVTFAPALPLAQSFDPARPAELVLRCARFADYTQVVDLAPTNPLGWPFVIRFGTERLNGATGPTAKCLGELDDPGFARNVLLPTYVEAVVADQPVVHRIAAIANNVLLSYRRLTIPLRAIPRAGVPSHLLMLTQLNCALPLIRSRDAGAALTLRERQCLSLAASGRGAKQMAVELGVSEKMVELHLAHARHKLGARTTTQAVAMALAMALDETQQPLDRGRSGLLQDVASGWHSQTGSKPLMPNDNAKLR